MSSDSIRATVKDYILREFLPGERPESLPDTTPLTRGGIITSIGMLKLVSFLEQHYGIHFRAHEMDELDTVSDIERVVAQKVAAR